MHDRRAESRLTVRAADHGDVERIVDLVESAYRGERSRAGWTTEADLLDGQRTDREAIADALRTDSSLILVAETDDDGLLACCQLDRHDGGVCHFGLFAVSPTRQGSGLGRQLLATAEEHARVNLGAAVMQMTVIAQRTDLIAWYERRGYSRTGDTKPFPYGDERFGLPRVDDLHFVVLAKPLG